MDGQLELKVQFSPGVDSSSRGSRPSEVSPDLDSGRSAQWVWAARDGIKPARFGRLNGRYDNLRGGTINPESGPTVRGWTEG